MDRGMMTTRRRSAIAATMLVLAGCTAAKGPLASAAVSDMPTWRATATDSDRARLRAWRDSWTQATDAVRKSGQGQVLDADPSLYAAEPARADAALPPGRYHCAWIKLGATDPKLAALRQAPPVDCRVTEVGKVKRFALTDGAQRPHGLIFTDDAGRPVFLGTLELSDETRALDYGRDDRRDMIGYLDRVDDRRWRLVLPQPQFESLFDIIEITPAAA